MDFILLTIGIFTLGISAVSVVLAMKFIRYIDRPLNSSGSSYIPKVTIIVPCKGLDPNFDGNIKALLKQDYPAYRVLFVTATDDDSAYPVLEQIIKNVSGIPTKLLTAGITQGRSQKINNQLRALEEVQNDTEVLVFLDSDICPHSKFLSNLVAPIEDPRVGVSTGFRWYLPVKGGFASLLRSTWNGGGVVFVSDDKTNYAWGGAMAIRKKVFEKVQVAKAWESALTDDFPLTLAVREAGYTANFVPRCLVASHEDCTFSEMLEWTNRQTIISKVYHPKLWRRIALAHGIGNIILALGTVLLAGFLIGITTDKNILLASILMLSMIPMEMINGLILLPAVKKMLPDHRERIQKLTWIYCLLAPLASLLALFNTVYSLFTNRITWRGVTYEMRSPTETIVC